MFKIYQKFADVLVDYSCEIKAGEKVIIEQEFVDNQFLRILTKTIRERGAYPIFVNRNSMVTNTLVELCDEQARQDIHHRSARPQSQGHRP